MGVTDPNGTETTVGGDGRTAFTHRRPTVPPGGLGEAGDGLLYRKRVSRVVNRRAKPREVSSEHTDDGGSSVDSATITDALGREWSHSMDSRAVRRCW